jgi:hypothetical protein
MIVRVRHAVPLLLCIPVAWGLPLWLAERHDDSVIAMAESAAFLSTAYTLRGESLVSHDTSGLGVLYDPSTKSGRYALSHERTRAAYIEQWADARGIELTKSTVRLRVTRVTGAGDQRNANVRQTAFLAYRYKGDRTGTTDEFAVDTLHSVTLAKQGGRWVIRKEWYLDPLKEDTLIPDVLPDPGEAVATQTSAASEEQPSRPRVAGTGRYDRAGAVAYASRYCGVALTTEGAHRYSADYRSYNGAGGDCTNFVSQVLHEGGGVPMSSAWHTYRRSGSSAWVRTDAFRDYLLYSGRAALCAKGTFRQVAAPRPGLPGGAVQGLQPGDLIGYQEKGDLVHFAVVVGHNSHGYPLVNSHTADRYRVPWDLGWDRRTVFCLMKIVY